MPKRLDLRPALLCSLLLVAGSGAQAQTASLDTDLQTVTAYTPTGKLIADPAVLAARDALCQAVRTPEKMDAALRGRLDQLLAAQKDGLVVTRQAPVSENDPLPWVLANYQSAVIQGTPPDKVTAYAGATDFPGAVPAGAPTVTKTITIDGTTDPAAWRSTGLYASPGARITVSTTAPIQGKGLQIRVGANADSLRNKLHHKYTRLPEISRVFPFDGGSIPVANAFGGLIYVMVPGGSHLGRVTVTLQGAVEAPYFVEGVTTPEQWKKIRENPAPWGEIEAKNVIFTVPASELRTVDDPAAVTAFWDKIVASAAAFAGRPAGILSFASVGPSRAERYVPDVDISAGYMHAGYPIMTMLDATASELSPDIFTGNTKQSKRWGLMHELGHNYQTQVNADGRFRDWTTGDAGEVTNNMVPLYISDQLGKEWHTDHPSLMKSEQQAADMIAAGQKPWESKDLFVKLCMYLQLGEGLGWDKIHQVMQEDYNLPANQHPKDDPEKRDQWLVRLSRASGKNLGPFFNQWGYATSASAQASVANLPTWMPSMDQKVQPVASK